MADTTIDSLDSLYSAKIDTWVTDTIDKRRAHVARQRWAKAAEQQQALENTEIQSYSIAGRTFSRRNASEGQAVVDQLEQQVTSYLYGTTVLLDANSQVAEP